MQLQLTPPPPLLLLVAIRVKLSTAGSIDGGGTPSNKETGFE